jgi:hypothetical protein
MRFISTAWNTPCDSRTFRALRTFEALPDFIAAERKRNVTRSFIAAAAQPS